MKINESESFVLLARCPTGHPSSSHHGGHFESLSLAGTRGRGRSLPARTYMSVRILPESLTQHILTSKVRINLATHFHPLQPNVRMAHMAKERKEERKKEKMGGNKN